MGLNEGMAVRRERIGAALEAGRAEVGTTMGCIYTLSGDGERALCQASSTRDRPMPLSFGLRLADCGGMRAALDGGQALAVEDAMSDRRVAAVAKSRFGIRACMYAPFSAGESSGVVIFSERHRHRWSSVQREAAEVAAQSLGSIIGEGGEAPRSWSERLWTSYPGWCGVMRADGVLVDGWWSDELGAGITLADLFGGSAGERLMARVEAAARGDHREVSVVVRCRARTYRVSFGTLGDGQVGLFIQLLEVDASMSEPELRELAAQLGHELNNALQYLANVLDDRVELAQAAQEVVARGGRLTDELLAYTGSPRRRSAAQLAAVHQAREVRDVLIVEDDANVARSLSRVLRRAGVEVRVAGTVADGVTLATERMPDAILLDMLLPDGTGHDVLHALGELDDGVAMKGTNVIVMTGFAEADALRRVRALGWPVLAKPFDPRDMVARLGLED